MIRFKRLIIHFFILRRKEILKFEYQNKVVNIIWLIGINTLKKSHLFKYYFIKVPF